MSLADFMLLTLSQVFIVGLLHGFARAEGDQRRELDQRRAIETAKALGFEHGYRTCARSLSRIAADMLSDTDGAPR